MNGNSVVAGRENARAGYSLMEMLIVIAILSAITLIAFPSLRRPLSQSLPQAAGQELLSELAALRSAAIDRGQVLLFQYQYGTDRYYLGTIDQRTVTESAQATPRSRRLPDNDAPHFAGPESRGSTSRNETDAGWGQKLLRGDVTFAAEATDRESAELDEVPFSANRPSDSNSEYSPERDNPQRTETTRQRADASRGRSDTSRSTSRDASEDVPRWSPPVRFYPSGRMQPVRVVISSQEGRQVVLEIQGLSGRIRLRSAK